MRRAHRLRRPADFQRVRAVRRSWGHPLLVLYAAPNDGQATRLGIAVGKRVGKAVVRNLVKRRVREAVRHRLPELRPGYDLVFIARPPAATAGWPAVASAVDELLRRARVVQPAGPERLASRPAGTDVDGAPPAASDGPDPSPLRPSPPAAPSAHA